MSLNRHLFAKGQWKDDKEGYIQDLLRPLRKDAERVVFSLPAEEQAQLLNQLVKDMEWMHQYLLSRLQRASHPSEYRRNLPPCLRDLEAVIIFAARFPKMNKPIQPDLFDKDFEDKYMLYLGYSTIAN